jgi:hypothetical protein
MPSGGYGFPVLFGSAGFRLELLLGRNNSAMVKPEC